MDYELAERWIQDNKKSHNTDDIKEIAENIIQIFKENGVLEEDGKYKKLYDDLCEFLIGLLK